MDESKSVRLLEHHVMLGKRARPEDATRRWNDEVSTLKMYPNLRELQGLGGDPIDFECKIFPGARALDILHKIQADLQGKNITPEKFSDRTFELGRKYNEDSCALTTRNIKECASNFNGGQWAFLDLGEESKWYQGYAAEFGGKWDLRASQNGGKIWEFRTSSIPRSKLGRGILKKRIEKPFTSIENMAILTCCTGLPRSTGQSQSGVDRILEMQAKADPKAFARCLQKFKLNRKIWSHWWIFQDDSMLGETECSRIWRIWLRCHLWAKLNISVQRRNSTIRSRKEASMSQLL